MQSRISFFNKMIFQKNISRFCPFWIGYFFICMIENPFAVFMAGHIGRNETYRYEQLQQILMGNYINVIEVLMSPYFVIAASIVTALCLFSYLFSWNSANMIHALPTNRFELYCTNYISGILILSIPQILATLITVFICLLYGITSLQFLFVALLDILAMTVLFYSMAVFVCMFSGQLIASAVFYFVLGFFVIGIEEIMQLFMSNICFGISQSRSGTILDVLSPMNYLRHNIGIHTKMIDNTNVYTIYGQKMILIYAIAGIFFMIAGYIVYKFKKLETTGDFISIQWLRPIFRWGFAFCTAFLSASVMGQIFKQVFSYKAVFIITVLSVVVFGMLGFFIAQMFLEKTLRVFRKRRFIEYALFGILTLGITFILEEDLLHFETRVPEVSQIKWVGFDQADYYALNNKDEIAQIRNIQKNIIKNKNHIESALSANTQTYHVKITYHLKNETKMVRYYTLPFTKVIEADKNSIYNKLIAMQEQPDLFLSSKMGKNYKGVSIVGGTFQLYEHSKQQYNEKNINLDEKDAKIIYQALLEDIEQGNMKTVLENQVLQYENFEDRVYANMISIDFYNKDGVQYNYYYGRNIKRAYLNTSDGAYFTFGIDSKNTIMALKKLGLIRSEEDLLLNSSQNETQ